MGLSIRKVLSCPSFGVSDTEVYGTDIHGQKHRCPKRDLYKYLDDRGLLGESTRYHKLDKLGFFGEE